MAALKWDDSAAGMIASLDDDLARSGEAVTLQRIPPDPVTGADPETVSCNAAVRIAASQDIIDPDMGDIAAVLSPTGLSDFGPLQRNDLIVTAAVTASVQSVRPIYVGADLVRIDLVCRGGAVVMDEQLTIRRATVGTNDFGEDVQEWTDLAIVWASKEDISGAEKFADQEVSGVIKARFRVRYSELVADINSKDRLLCDGREYGIVAVTEIGRRDELEITASARTDLTGA